MARHLADDDDPVRRPRPSWWHRFRDPEHRRDRLDARRRSLRGKRDQRLNEIWGENGTRTKAELEVQIRLEKQAQASYERAIMRLEYRRQRVEEGLIRYLLPRRPALAAAVLTALGVSGALGGATAGAPVPFSGVIKPPVDEVHRSADQATPECQPLLPSPSDVPKLETRMVALSESETPDEPVRISEGWLETVTLGTPVPTTVTAYVSVDCIRAVITLTPDRTPAEPGKDPSLFEITVFAESLDGRSLDGTEPLIDFGPSFQVLRTSHSVNKDSGTSATTNYQVTGKAGTFAQPTFVVETPDGKVFRGAVGLSVTADVERPDVIAWSLALRTPVGIEVATATRDGRPLGPTASEQQQLPRGLTT
jgi:hypothetical protein